jgi:hypothetical protein
MSDYSKDKLIEFLGYLPSKGLMNLSTAQSRKAAVNAVLGVLDPAELEDVRKLDIDEVMQRFQNLKGTSFKPESIKVYRSRVANAINDFQLWKADPSSFKPFSASKPHTGAKPKERSKASQNHAEDQIDPLAVTFPIPIRPGTVVKIVGLPGDLTKAEASRIANVIQALATERSTE